MADKRITIVPQPGFNVELNKLIEAGKLLMEMGYAVRRTKVKREDQKTLLNALEIRERDDEKEAGGKINVD